MALARAALGAQVTMGVPITVAGVVGYMLAGLPHQDMMPPLSIGFVSFVGLALIAPAAYHHLGGDHATRHEDGFSFEVSIVLIVSYVLGLIFSLRTHRELFAGRTGEGVTVAEQDQIPRGSRLLAVLALVNSARAAGAMVPGRDEALGRASASRIARMSAVVVLRPGA